MLYGSVVVSLIERLGVPQLSASSQSLIWPVCGDLNINPVIE